jgi:hypothetical protein
MRRGRVLHLTRGERLTCVGLHTHTHAIMCDSTADARGTSSIYSRLARLARTQVCLRTCKMQRLVPGYSKPGWAPGKGNSRTNPGEGVKLLQEESGSGAVHQKLALRPCESSVGDVTKGPGETCTQVLGPICLLEAVQTPSMCRLTLRPAQQSESDM